MMSERDGYELFKKGREEERERIVAWLRREHVEIRAMRAGIRNLDECADAIERGDHSPTR